MNKIVCIPAFTDNYFWLIVNTDNKTAAVVDPGDAEPVIDYLDKHQLQLTDILATHHHADHVGGIEHLVDRYHAEVHGPKSENIPRCGHLLAESDTVLLKSLKIEFEVIDVPGHTSGHIAYYGSGMLFCGDTLFAGGCGRLFEGTPQQMLDSLTKLKNLPDNTAVYCAHEYTQQNLAFARSVDGANPALLDRIEWTEKYRKNNLPTVPSTIRLEKETNPFLRANQEALILSAEAENPDCSNSEVDVFATIREMKDTF